MGYQALVTIGLPHVSDRQYKAFNTVLEEKRWYKIKMLATAWSLFFADGISRENAISILKSDLENAKIKSMIKTVKYAIQLDKDEIIIDTLYGK